MGGKEEERIQEGKIRQVLLRGKLGYLNWGERKEVREKERKDK